MKVFIVNNVDKQILKDFNVEENSYNILCCSDGTGK